MTTEVNWGKKMVALFSVDRFGCCSVLWDAKNMHMCAVCVVHAFGKQSSAPA